MCGQLPGVVDYDNRDYVNVWDEVSTWCSRFGALILDAIELRPNTVGLDLACGTGYPVIELAQIHGPSCRFAGVDAWQLAVERARRKAKIFDVGNVEFVLADAAKLPFQDETFNLLTMNLGVNNLADVQGVFAEAARVAQPGTRFLLTSNVVGHMAEFYSVFRSVLVDLGLSDRLPLVDENEDHRLGADALGPMLRQCGFGDVTAKVTTFEMRYLDFEAMLNHMLTRIGFLPAWRTIVPPERELEIFEEVGRRLGRPISMSVPMLLLEAKKGR